ncbi:MAG: hypothetical protein F4Y12_02240 [Acidimicrobiaceae bacterium]|nr:hypothetical protein [Acidimicrobiaceae bacterium]MYH78255.1 hypothetical protein [Acidimicrobiaceae bacterium]
MRDHHTDYDRYVTDLCERVLLTLLGDVGPWSDRIYLAGGLAPRYLVGQLPDGARAHVGTTDVDLIIGLALGDEVPETYRTLHNNLKNAGFRQMEPSFRWSRTVDGARIYVEFLCETDQVASGAIFRPREGTGSSVGAFNVRGAQLATRDYIERTIEGDRLDDGGRSTVTVRVAGILTYTVLKILAFQDRHENKDAYDLVFTIANYPGGPTAAGRASADSPVAGHPQVAEAIVLLAARFADASHDGPHAYASFLADPDNNEAVARLRNEAVAAIGQYVTSFFR